jgi:hypothetical protein
MSILKGYQYLDIGPTDLEGSGEKSCPHRATTKWASDDQNEHPESSEAVIMGAHRGDRNEPQSSDTTIRSTTSCFFKLPIWARDRFPEHSEAGGKVRSVSEATTRWFIGHGKEFERSEATTRWASGHGKELEGSEATTRWASDHGKELEGSEATTRWASGHGEELESSEATTRWASGHGREPRF